jgi:hypothetical protein
VDKILDGLLEGIKGAGEAIANGLDQAPLKSKGPHRGVDALLDGIVDTPKTLGQGIAAALDKPLEAVR